MTEYGDHVHIICFFAVGSNARGCRIVLSSDDTGKGQDSDSDYVYTASRIAGSSEAATVIVLPNGNYTLDVFDNDHHTENPAYSTVLTISYSNVTGSYTQLVGQMLLSPNTQQVPI